MHQRPAPTPEQSLLILEILERWTQRGWTYSAGPVAASDNPNHRAWVFFTDPEKVDLGDGWKLSVFGVNHFDALCQATVIMQVLLEEAPQRTDAP